MFGARGDGDQLERRYRPPILRRVRPVHIETTTPPAAQAFESAARLLTTHLESALQTSDGDAFVRYWEDNFEEFLSAFRFFQTVADKVVSKNPELRERLGDAVEARVEACASTLGEDAAEEVRFAIDTLHRANHVVVRMKVLERAGRVPDEPSKDAGFASLFNVAYAWHSIGFNCVAEIVDEKAKPAPTVTNAAIEMMRSGSLEAYHAAREGLRLRQEPTEIDEGPVPFDEEDRRLADEHLSDVEQLIRDVE